MNSMLKNHLKLVLRKLKKEKVYSFVNIFGLTIGLTAFLIIALYVKDELSFDKGIAKYDNTYRIYYEHKEWGIRGRLASNYLEIVGDNIPQITRFSRITNYNNPQLLTVGESSIYSNKVLRVDPNFFEFFNFELKNAKPESVFNNSSTVVITTELAEKLFGDENPIGQAIEFDKKETLFVSALVEPAEKNSSIQFDMLRYDEGLFSDGFDKSGGMTVMTYVTLENNARVNEVENLLNEAKTLPVYRDFLEGQNFGIFPFENQRLYAPYPADYFETNSISYVLMFIAIGVSVLLLAIINYVNLVTAQAIRRYKEVGLRKVVGASRGQLVAYQFAESITVTVISFCLSFALTERLIPSINTILDKEIKLEYFSLDFLIWVLIIGVAIGILSGAYPAFYITRFKPLTLLQKNTTTGGKGWLRKTLVLFQFVTSGILLTVLVIISQQMNFLKSKELGFTSELLVNVPLYQDSVRSYQTIKNELSSVSGLESVSLGGFQPGSKMMTSISNSSDRKAEGSISSSTDLVFGDNNFLETTQIEVLWKSPHFRTNEFTENQVIINESLARKLELLDKPDGKRLYRWNDQVGLELVAIVKDFHLQPLKESVNPTSIQYLNDWGTRNLLLRLNSQNQNEVLAKVGESYENIFNRPFEFHYVDDEIREFYRKEEGQFRLFKVFATLAISISLLGLFALTIFTIEQRRKEVSIRKILGASLKRLLLMLNREYSILVFLAFIIASPVAFYAMQGWLTEFEYRITISPFLFVGIFSSFLVLCWLVTLSQSLKVTRENPADTLREE